MLVVAPVNDLEKMGEEEHILENEAIMFYCAGRPICGIFNSTKMSAIRVNRFTNFEDGQEGIKAKCIQTLDYGLIIH